MVELPPHQVRQAQHQGQAGKQRQHASREAEVVLTKTPEAFLVAAAHQQQPADLESQHRQHAGHGVQQQTGQNAHQQRFAQTGDFQRGIGIARGQLQFKALRRRQKLAGLPGETHGRRAFQRIGSARAQRRGQPPFHLGSGSRGGRGVRHVGQYGLGIFQFVPLPRPGGSTYRGQRLRHHTGKALVNGQAIAIGTKQHAQARSIGLAHGLFRQNGKKHNFAFIGENRRLRIIKVALHGSGGIPDRQHLPALQREIQHGGTARVTRLVGIGMVARRYAQVHGNDDAVAVAGEIQPYGNLLGPGANSGQRGSSRGKHKTQQTDE